MKTHEAISEGLLLLAALVLVVILPHHKPIQPPLLPAPIAKAAVAQPAKAEAPAPKIPAQPKPTAPAAHTQKNLDTHTRVIVVSLEDRRLALLQDGQVQAVYIVAVGKDSTPSPTGTFTIRERVANPTYFHKGKVVPPGPGNPVGTRWMGLSQPGYGIHGTNAPHSIGKAASHGCIRMAQPDLENLFAQVRTGDTVEIIGERNPETAALFGAPAIPSAPAAPTQTVLAQAAPATDQPAAQIASPTLTTAGAATIAAAIPVGQ